MLNERLRAVSEMVDDGAVIADIGCDHALLCIELVLTHKVKKAYAIDNKTGPLQRAQANIEYYRVADRVEAVLANGLDGLREDVDTIIICGMGFDTMSTILEAHPSTLLQKQLILQPNQKGEALRAWISAHQYKIMRERIVVDRGHYYPIISFVAQTGERLSEEEILLGKWIDRDDAYVSYLHDLLAKKQEILLQLPAKHPSNEKIRHEIILIQRRLGA